MRSRFVAAVLVLITMLAFSGPAEGIKVSPSGMSIISGPYLQQVTQTSIVIMWETNLAATSEVDFGKSAPLSPGPKIQERSRIHEVKLSGLDPQTNYCYRVRSRSGALMKVESDIYTFQTAVEKDSAFAFVVMGDNRTLWWNFRKIARKAYGERPNFVINVGDVVTMGKYRYQWRLEYLWPAQTLMQRVPTYIAIGNHEYYSLDLDPASDLNRKSKKNLEWFYKYSSYPDPETYYSFDYGNAHFTVIDSNEDFEQGNEQLEWIEEDLAATDADWKFVAHHHPPYSSDLDDYGDTRTGPSRRGDLNVRSLVPLYEKYGVDIVWYGHVHDYERTWPLREGKVDRKKGVIYIQSGGGGAELEDFAPTRSWFTAKVMRNWQYCYVTIHKNLLRMVAYDIEGRMYDYLELTKKPDQD